MTFKNAMHEMRWPRLLMYFVAPLMPAVLSYTDPWPEPPSLAVSVMAYVLFVGAGWLMIYSVTAVYAWGMVLSDRLIAKIPLRSTPPTQKDG